MDSRHDQAFFQILSEEKNITNFLDSVFGFLHRCTDFYVIANEENQIGFLPGVVENLVNESLQKWKIKSILSKKTPEFEKSAISSEVPEEFSTVDVAQEVEIDGTEDVKKNVLTTKQPSDSYNGAVRDNYTWSQTISDLSVIVQIPEDVKSTNQLKVNITSDDIEIRIKSTNYTKDCNECEEWNNILNGQFSFKICKDESYWSFVSGQHIIIHLEKAVERWWEALLVGETKIELAKIDCSRNLDELGVAEQMKVEELIWNQQQKLLNKPTSEEIRVENILKKAWNAEGSPFKGQTYDPSLFKFN